MIIAVSNRLHDDLFVTFYIALRDQVSIKEIGQKFLWLHKHTVTRTCL